MNLSKWQPLIPIALVTLVVIWLATAMRFGPAANSSFTWEFPQSYFFHDSDEQRAKHDVLLGKPMPPLEVTDWTNGPITPDEMKGKVVVLDFWATWCGPCIAAFPHNNELAEKYRDQGVLLVGVCTSSGQEQFAETLKKGGVNYPNARDPNLSAERAWGVMWYPTYAVVDRKGIVRAVGLSPNNLEDVIKKLAAEPV